MQDDDDDIDQPPTTLLHHEPDIDIDDKGVPNITDQTEV